MRMTRAATFLVLLFVVACSANPRAESVGAEEIVYLKEGTSVIKVFNVKRRWFSNLGLSYLKRRDGSYGEFGGSFEFCSDAEYLCLDGGIAAAIPKKFDGQTSWQFHGISCKADSPVAKDLVVTIDCSSGNWSNRLIYSQAQGITSYSIAAEPGQKYTLLAPPGLLARDSGMGNLLQ